MPEPAPVQPLTNDELAEYHGQVAGARQSYDPDHSDTFIRPQDAWAQEASDEFVFHRIRHATDAQEDLVTQREPGRHELSFDRLTADFDQLGKYVREDIGALTGAIRDPGGVRQTWWDQYDRSGGNTWRPSKSRDSKDPLSLEEAKYFLEDRESAAPDNETEALHSASLRVTTALLENWKRKYYSGSKMPEDSDIPLYLEHQYGGQTKLGKHLENSQARENVELHFRSIHRDHVARLGKAAADAAGVRRHLSGDADQALPEVSGDATLSERRDELTRQSREHIMHSPAEVRRLMSRARSEYVDRMLAPARRKAETDPSEPNTRRLAKLEGKIADIRLLYRFVSRWQSQAEDGNEVGFDEYMSGLAKEREAESGLFAEVNGSVPDDVERRRSEFDGAYYGAYNSADPYSFTSVLQRAAHGRANLQLHSQRAA